jgi:uncharacterized short protein YbdD (DUF466 family)
VPSRLSCRLRAVAAALGDVVRGAAGTDAYAHYLDHLRRHHPGSEPLTRADFFRRELTARWSGIRRCC